MFMARVGVVLFLASVLGCTAGTGRPTSESQATQLVLATTTSTRDSGLLDALLPVFEEQHGFVVKVVAVGSGQAMELGRRGDADVLLTHSPAAEEVFMSDGYGESRLPVMHNDFVIVGPKDDPAGVKQTTTAGEALGTIAKASVTFVSRGDNSGTHAKEQQIWEAANRTPSGDWYVSAGSGMGAVLRIASEKQAYTLSDRGTFLAQHEGLELAIHSAADPLLANPYSVIVVSKKANPQTRQNAAKQFAAFLRAESTQKQIETFGVARFGQPLFFPDAMSE